MQSADHVHLGDAEGERISHGLNNFVNCIFECMSVAFLRGKSAELARQDADVRVIDVAIVDISCVIAVLPLAHHVGDHSKSVKIVCTIKRQSVRF